MARKKLANLTPQQLAQKWSAGYGGSGANLAAGVANPTQDPTAAAIAQQTTMATNWNASINNGTWKANLQKAGLKGWQAGMTAKTIPNLANNAAAGQAHYQTFIAQWKGAVAGMVANLPARGSYAQNKARSAAMQDALHAVKGQYRRLWRGT